MTEEGRNIFKEYYNNFVKEHNRSPNIEESFFDGNRILAQHIIELQKDKGNLIDELTKKADTNHSLVEQMADLEEKNAKLKSYCITCVYTDSPCLLSDYPRKNGICSHYKNVFVENEELKRENRGIKTCTNCDEYVIGRCCNYPNGVCHHWKLSEKYRNDDKLTKAKGIIRQFLNDYPVITKEILDKLEQFIKEIEK